MTGNNVTYSLNAMGNAIGYSNTLLTLFGQSLEQVNSRALNGNDIDCILGNGFAKEEFGHPIDGIPCQMQAGVDFYHDPFKDMVHSMLDDSHNGQEREVYFYHSDHLGSASWITDSGGQAIQHLQYLPYGEPYINQRTSGYNERFTFTGKERDEETGYGYFGARYMDHELMTMWLSVDPMADKYPSISPYNYCMWNPIKKVDEYGMEADIPPLLAKFCSAERQANSFLNNPKRKGRFVRSAYSSFDADGRETITVRPNYNYADKYDAQSPSDGILLPTIYVTDKGLGDRDFTDGDIYHFFHSIGKKIQHFENNLLPHTDCGLSSRIDRMEIEGAAKVLFYMSLGVSIYEGIAAKAWLSVGSDIVGTGLSHLGNTSHPFPRYFGAVGSTGIDCYTLARPGPSPNIGGGKVSSVMSIINTGVTHYYDNQDKKQ